MVMDIDIDIDIDLARKVLATVDAGLVSGLGAPVPGEMCVEAAVCYALGLPHGDTPKCVAPALRAFKIHLNDSVWSSPTSRSRGMRRLALVQLGSAGRLGEIEFCRRLSKWSVSVCVPFAFRAAASAQKDAQSKAALLHHADQCEKKGTREAVRKARNVTDDVADVADVADAAADAAAYAANAVVYAANAVVYAAHAVDASAYAAGYAAHAAANAADAAANAADAAGYAADVAHAAAADSDRVLSRFAEDVVQLLVEMGAPGARWLELAPLPEHPQAA